MCTQLETNKLNQRARRPFVKQAFERVQYQKPFFASAVNKKS